MIGRPAGRVPATEWIRVTSSASSRVSGGRMPGRRRPSIVLPGSRRARQEHVVLSRGCKLERPSSTLLAPNLGEVGQERLLELVASRRCGERDVLLAAQVGDRLREVADRDDVDAGEGGLGSGLGSTEEARQPGPAGTLGDGDRAGDGAHAAVERELSHAGVLEQAGGRELMRAREERERDREVEPRPLLAQRRRSEVDGDPVPRGPGQHAR